MHTHHMTGQVTGKTRSRPARVPTQPAPGVILGAGGSRRRPLLKVRANAPRETIEEAIERLIALLDLRDAPMADMEPEEDCCGAADDDLTSDPHRQQAASVAGPGTPEDAETNLGWPEAQANAPWVGHAVPDYGDLATDRELDLADDEDDFDGEAEAQEASRQVPALACDCVPTKALRRGRAQA